MPPRRFCDWWWEDMPEGAHRAAEVLGYTKETWDKDADIPYDDKPFGELTLVEKRAAMFLGMSVIDSKLDIWWEDTDSETKKHAAVLGWDKHKWDHDWVIQDLPCEHWYWKDMTEEQREAAIFFGYDQSTWDETEEDEFVVDEQEVTKPPAEATKPHGKEEEKKDEESSEEEEEDAEEGNEEAKKKKKKPKKKPPRFSKSKMFGGDQGTAFDHQNHKTVHEIEIFTEGKIINGIQVTYEVGQKQKSGGTDGVASHKLTLDKGEYINHIVVRADKVVQELTFMTNKGKKLGPCGGKGRMMRDKEGKEADVWAPVGLRLGGFMGRESKNYIDAIAFRWAPIAN